MIYKPGAEYNHTFIVRIWYEADQAGDGQWRGMVEQMQSQQRRYFTSFAEMNEFMFRIMQDSPEKPTDES
jgi:hypothetical protein